MAINARPKECYTCGGKGHFAVVCPTRDQKLALASDNAEVTGERQGDIAWDEETEEVSINEVLERSKLPLCVIRRVLTGQKKDEEMHDIWL